MKFEKHLIVRLVTIQALLAIVFSVFVYLQMQLINTLGGGDAGGTLAIPAAASLALYIFLDLLETYQRGSLYANFSVRLKTKAAKIFMAQSRQDYGKKSGETHISYFSNELDAVLNQHYYFKLYGIRLLFQFVASFVMLLVITWQCGLAVTAAAVGFALVIKFAGKTLTKKQKRLQEKKTAFVDVITEIHNGCEEIHLNQMEDLAEEDFFGSNATLEQEQYEYRLFQYGIETMGIAQNMLIYILILIVGGVLAKNGLTALGVLISASGLSVQLLNHWALLSRINVTIKGVESLKKESDRYLCGETPLTGVICGEHGGEKTVLKASGLSYSYEPGRCLLEDTDLLIKTGETHLITGESGSGKSTLLDLLAGYRDCEIGEIERGADKIVYIPQDPFLFQGTLRQNIVFDRGGGEDALRSLLHSLDLDLDLDMMVEEGGSNLSGGQKSRIALARALMMEPDLLITDELTAHLDGTTGRKIEEMLLTAYPKMALCSVAHRTYCAEKYDKRWILFENRLEEVKESAA